MQDELRADPGSNKPDICEDVPKPYTDGPPKEVTIHTQGHANGFYEGPTFENEHTVIPDPEKAIEYLRKVVHTNRSLYEKELGELQLKLAEQSAFNRHLLERMNSYVKASQEHLNTITSEFRRAQHIKTQLQ